MRLTTLATTAGMLLMSAVALAQSVTYDYDKAADFSTFKTYAWVRGTNVPDELIHQRVVGSIDTQLAAKGLIKAADAATADVLVAYHASFDKDLQITGFSSGWGPYRFGGARSGTARAEEILVGTLVVDVVHARTKTIVWRGTAVKDVNVKASPEKRDKNIAKAAEKLFKHFPPHQS
jgi:Domain of unknown function (DUF4136)